jgi:arylamine N-acetyltransferase
MEHLLNPLEKPADERILNRYLSFFGINRHQDQQKILQDVVQSFARLPYENLTKIIKDDEETSHEKARRQPGQVIEEYIRYGAGGTCFSLTAALLHLIRALGWQAEPILGDRRYGQNTHCALIVWIDGKPCLIDPGYLLLTPVEIPEKNQTLIENPFNTVKLIPKERDKVDLYTLESGKEIYRLTFKANPADAGEFLKAWDGSFDWDMMNYPLLTRVLNNEQIYLRGERLQFRSFTEVRKQELGNSKMCDEIVRLFQIDEKIVRRAVEILKRKGA